MENTYRGNCSKVHFFEKCEILSEITSYFFRMLSCPQMPLSFQYIELLESKRAIYTSSLLYVNFNPQPANVENVVSS